MNFLLIITQGRLMICFWLLSCFLVANSVSAMIENKLGFAEYCLYHGYPTQTHIVRTKDGYNLKFFRLQEKNSTIQERRKVVYLQHGLEDSSDTWVLNEQDKAPGFILANKGYDVWLGNVRGNHYSNPQLSPRVKDFWDFSFDEMIKYDLPAAFEYINGVTNQKINYIGHSQGAMIMLGALSEKNRIVSNLLETFSAIGPGPYIAHHDSAMFKVIFGTPLLKILHAFEAKQLLYSGSWLRIGLSYVCSYLPSICGGILQLQSEKNNTVNNLERVSNYFAKFPSGSSVKNFDHFKQIMQKDQYSKFDYGEKKNQEIYGTKVPPVYDLSKVEFPSHVFIGAYDRLVVPVDGQRVYKQLGSKIKTLTVLNFGHMTFVWGKDMGYVEKLASIIEAGNSQ